MIILTNITNIKYDGGRLCMLTSIFSSHIVTLWAFTFYDYHNIILIALNALGLSISLTLIFRYGEADFSRIKNRG